MASWRLVWSCRRNVRAAGTPCPRTGLDWLQAARKTRDQNSYSHAVNSALCAQLRMDANPSM